MNMVMTPEDSPERVPNNLARTQRAEKEAGGKFNHMAQGYEALSRSVHQL